MIEFCFQEKRPYSLKAIIVGNVGSGKSSLVMRFAKNLFYPNHVTTIGVDHYTTRIEHPHGPVSLRVYDIGGKFHSWAARQVNYVKSLLRRRSERRIGE